MQSEKMGSGSTLIKSRGMEKKQREKVSEKVSNGSREETGERKQSEKLE